MTAAQIAAAHNVHIGSSVQVKPGIVGAGATFTVTTLVGAGAQVLRGPGDVYVGDARRVVRLADVMVAE